MLSIKSTLTALAILITFAYENDHSDLTSASLGLPTNLFWGKLNGTSYLTVTKSLKNLEWCSGTWAMAATSVLSDRFKVLRNASWPDYNIAPQVALTCITKVKGCFEEGDPAWVYDYIIEKGITDETCAVYRGLDFSNGGTCNRYTRSQLASLVEIVMFLADIMLNSTDQFWDYSSSDDILVPEDSPNNGTVYVSIVGYGVNATGTNYWIGRNSWGIGWGDVGFFNLIRGNNALGIEEYCVYPTPNLTITLVTNNSQGEEEKSYISDFNLPKLEEETKHHLRAKPSADENLAAVPSAWDWRNANGKNYLSWVRNQNLPEYCAASWAFAPASSVTDRLNIMFFNNTFPQFIISPQDMINWNIGSCGYEVFDTTLFYKTFLTYGFSDETCLMYIATNSYAFTCVECWPPAPQLGEFADCRAILPPITFRISSYKNLAGATKMMQEIYTNGPITCGIYNSTNFARYAGGIYSEITGTSQLSLYVSVVGWGVDPSTKTQYWIGRNSLGTGWGEYGFFRMQMFRDNLGIETDCVAAVPSFK